MDTFGEWLREQRNKSKLSREALSKRAGCSAAMLRKIEEGERRPSVQTAELLAYALDVPTPERETFIRVARGEWGTERLARISSLIRPPNLTQASSATAPRSNLPILPTPLIGRKAELAQLEQILRDPQARLLTLIGAGGIGKTRLAIEAASPLQNEFADGVYFVSLARLHSGRFIIPVIADLIGFAFHNRTALDPKKQLLDYLAGKALLLLMDNMEHLLKEPEIEFLAELLQQSPGVKLLITSREPVNLQDEWIFDVQGLPLPQDGETQGTSVELFLQRARRAHVNFNPGEKDYPAILRICKLVDGMPLGIELAAAWVRILSCDEIAKEIERGLDFLHASARDLPPRHRSIRTVFDHSWKLLSGEEQSALAKLSVFQGGFSRDAAEQVAGATLSVLASLVTKSLIQRNSAGRYDLHELVRQYAADRLAEQPAEKEAAGARHGAYYLSLLSNQEALLKSSAQRETLAQLTTEIDNLRLAWNWGFAHGRYDLFSHAAGAFVWFYDIRGWMAEGNDHLEHVIQAIDQIESTRKLSVEESIALARMLTCRAILTFRQGNARLAEIFTERSLKVLRPIHSPEARRSAVSYAGIVKYALGKYEAANELFEEAFLLLNEVGNDPWAEAVCLSNLGLIAGVMGHQSEGYEKLHASLIKSREAGDPRLTTLIINLLTPLVIRLGRFDEASRLIHESLELDTAIGDRWGLGTAYRNLGLLAQMQGDHNNAEDKFLKSLEVFSELGARWDLARSLADLGRTLLALGDDVETERILQAAFKILAEIQGYPVALDALTTLASLRANQGHHGKAYEWLCLVLDHQATSEETRARATHLHAEVQAKLAPTQIEAAQSATLEYVIAEMATTSGVM